MTIWRENWQEGQTVCAVFMYKCPNDVDGKIITFTTFGILLPKLFWPTVRKNCSSDQEKLMKFEAEGRGFAKLLKSLKQLTQTVKGTNNFW